MPVKVEITEQPGLAEVLDEFAPAAGGDATANLVTLCRGCHER